MSESSDKNYLSQRKKSKNTEKGKTSKKNHMASISRSIQDIISATLSPSDDEDKSNLISIGGPAGDFKEQHHPSAIKKSFQQFRKDAFAGLGGTRKVALAYTMKLYDTKNYSPKMMP